MPSEVFKNCSEDVTSHLSSFLSSSEIEQCPNSNEQWLIENRFGADIDENAFLCGKHRSKYGLGFKGVKCCYPGHTSDTAKKGKGTKDLRMILASQLKAVKKLHSTPFNLFHLPIGSVWCNKCRIFLHPPTMEHYIDDESVCLVCGEVHTETSQFETPQKRMKLSTNISPQEFNVTPCSQVSLISQDSQEEYMPEELKKDTFNKSIANLDATWTPLRHKVRKNFSDLNPKVKDTVVKKAIKAINVVLEEIAPGQSCALRNEIFKRHVEIDIPKQIKDAVLKANGNVKIQLLSLVSGKNKEGRYNFTIEEIMSMFPGVSKHYVQMARNHVQTEKVGLPIISQKYWNVQH